MSDVRQGDDIIQRVRDLEELVRAQLRLEEAMYGSDLEAGWPRDAGLLIERYKAKYGVNLASEIEAEADVKSAELAAAYASLRPR